MVIAKCFVCGTEKKLDEVKYLFACSKECRASPEYKEERNKILLSSRGYPMGYHSKEEYDNVIARETATHFCVCGKEYIGNKIGCSPECIETLRIQKIRKTKLERYGDEKYNNKEAIKSTCLEKYGVTNPLQSPIIRAKAEATLMEKYGVDNFAKTKEFSEIYKNVMQDKYGVNNYFQRNDLMQQHWVEHLGAANPLGNTSIATKAFETRKTRYELSGAVPKQSSEETCRQKYGANTFFGSVAGNMNYENLKLNYGWSDDELIELSSKRATPTVFGKASRESLKVFIPLYKFARKTLELSPEDIHWGIEGSSEYKLYDSNLSRVYYYDFSIPSYKLLIEFNGVAFHPKSQFDEWESPYSKENAASIYQKDQNKRDCAASLGYNLLTIWSDESVSNNISTSISFLSSHIQKRTNHVQGY